MRLWKSREIRVLWLAALAALFALAALCIVLVLRTSQAEQFREQSATNCTQINLLKSAIRGVLDDSERASLQREGLTADQVEMITTYYERQRARFAADECLMP